MPPKLVFISGSRAGTSIPLIADRATIGRHPESDIKFAPDEVLVSSNHATITRKGEDYILADIGSRNGTYINEEPLTGERTLETGDVIQFGARGPTAQFVVGTAVVSPTLDASDRPTTVQIFREAQRRASERETNPVAKGFSTTREFAVLALQRSSKRAKATSIGLGVVMLLGVVGVGFWQERSKAELQDTLDQIAVQLQSEQGSRALLEQNLANIQTGYDSLLLEVEQSRERLQQSPASRVGLGETVNRMYGNGVALLVYSYGFVKAGTNELLRFQVDKNGQPILDKTNTGQGVPRIEFGGQGPPLARHGSATGFLVDSSGWIITNKHVAVPWADEEDLTFLRQNGLNVEPRFIVMQAIFPPGDQSYDLTVHATSDDVDLAILRTPNGVRVNAPALPLASRESNASPGQQVVFIGYPTGVHNLLFRIPEAERTEILQVTGEEPVPLARELARRGLIQPLVIGGTVSDTTATEIIHTAGTTGGGSGGPLIGANREVVGIHYAAVRSPIEGDPFRTQRGVKVGFVWEILPGTLGTSSEGR